MWLAGVVLKDGKALSADLVVDCSGRSSSMPRWLEAAGFRAPSQMTVNSGLGEPARLHQCTDMQPVRISLINKEL
jgi:hypothetical protein